MSCLSPVRIINTFFFFYYFVILLTSVFLTADILTYGNHRANKESDQEAEEEERKGKRTSSVDEIFKNMTKKKGFSSVHIYQPPFINDMMTLLLS